MPIYDQAYRKYEARGALRRLRFWPITREGLRMLLPRGGFFIQLAFYGMQAIVWIPMLFRLGQIYLVSHFPESARLVQVDGRLFGEFLNGQIFGLLLLTIFAGS